MANIGGGLPYDPAIISVSSRSAPASDGAPAASAGSSRAGTPSRNSPLGQIIQNQRPGRGGYQQSQFYFLSNQLWIYDHVFRLPS